MPKGAIPSQGKRVTRVLPKKIGVERRPPALPGGGRLGQISQHYRDQGWRPTFTPSVMPEYPDPGVEKSLQKDIHLKKRPTTEDFLAGWDWQTAERGPNGEALPKGALSWSPRGEPFFGQGLPGWWKEFVWKINKDSIGDPDKIWEPIKGDIPKIEGGLEKAAQFGLTALQAGSRLYQQAAQGEEGEKPTIPQKVVRTVGGLVGGALSLLGEAGQKAEQSFLGGGIGRREAGAGSALPAVDVGPEWLDYVLNALPPVGIYNSIRVLTSPKTMAEKLDIIEENIQAGRIAYSAALDPMLREEYIRMYREGYAPSVIEWELENPLAEMVGELINDPLNVLGGWMGKATKATKALREAELFYDVAPEIAKALGAADEITEGSKAVGRLQELAEAVGTAMQRTKAGLTKYAQDASFAATTATGKRHITIKQIGQFSAWVMANHKKDPDQAYDLLQALAKLAGDNLDERVDALTTIKNSMAPRMFLSEVGNRTGIVMRQIIGVGDDGKLASGKNFLDEVRKIEKIEDAIAFAEKRMGRVIDDMFPTVAERVAKAKKGEAVMVGGVNMAQPSAAARAVSAFDAVMQKNLYRPLNTFFAGVYMGLSPAYAMRNAMNNNLTMLVDYGLGIFLGKRGIKRADSWLDSASKWLGYVPKVEGFTPGAAVETAALWRRLPFQKLSEVWERKAAERITGYVVEKTMLRALKPGRALPHVDDLLKAGLSEGAARQFVKLIVENFGDVKAARQQLMAASRLGNMSVLDSAAWLADKDADLLRSLNAHDDLIDLVREGRKAGKSLDDALADVRRVRQEVLKKAKQTESEVATIADDAVGFDDVATMAEHGVDDGLKAVASNKFQANNNAVDAYEQAVRVLAGYFESDPEISPLLVRFFTNHGNLWQKAHRQGQEFAQLWGGKHYTRWVAEFGRERKLDYAAIWNQLPWDNATKGAIPKEWGEFRKRFWEEWYYPTQDAFYREAREAYVKGADELIDALPVDRIPADNQGAVLERVADARRNRDLARMYDDTLPPGILRLRIEDAKAHKDNVFAAQLYGKQYGIDPPQYNHVLNTINKQLRLDGKAEYEHLYDIPPEVAEQAFANRIVRQAEEAAANEQMTFKY